MSKRTMITLALMTVVALSLGIVIAASAVSGAAFTTFNPWVDGDFKDVCKNTQINCNIYGAKPDVWLNGGPAANGLGPDGEYFFAVLVPGGQPDPNDGGVKNLSDEHNGPYTDRTFTVTDGEVSFYGGSHDQDSGDTLDANRPFCDSPRGCDPDGNPPFIRLFPYDDTTNPGGVYILAICHIGDGSLYPVEPRDCKYDAFKVKEGKVTYELMLQGVTFKDFLPDGPGGVDPVTDHAVIHVNGTGFAGETIDETISTDNGFWGYQVTYSFNQNDDVPPAVLTVCATPLFGFQTWPVDDGCYELTINPEAMAFVGDLDFGFWLQGLPRR